MLFSREFLEAAKAHLSPGGVMAQWIHQYETDDRSLELVLRTYRSVFDHVSVWTAYSNDILLLGFRNEGSGIDHFRFHQRFAEPAIAAALARAGVTSFPALLAHELVPLGAINAVPMPGPIHTLLRPQLNDLAGRGFFRGTFANLPFMGMGDAAREGIRHSMLRGYIASLGGRLPDDQRAELVAEACRYRPKTCQVLLAAWQRDEPDSPAFHQALDSAARADTTLTPDERSQRLAEIASLFPDGAAPREEVVTPATARRITDLFLSLYLHGEPFDGQKLIDLWSRCRDEALTYDTCEADIKRAREQFPLEDDAHLKARIPSCGNKVVIGKVCQDGMSRAQRLLAP
jgi:hypothetical protein